MKLNKSKNKGKVHPSPSTSSSAASSFNDPVLSLNHLLPTAILTLISVLSLQDREALAYMITHSLKSSSLCYSYPSSSSLDPRTKKKSNKKPTTSTTTSTDTHSSPCFDCCCFDCFSHFWNRWDSSPHSELIHQAIEAFEEYLSSSEKTRSKKRDGSNSSKRRAKTASLFADLEERESCVVPLDIGDGGKNEEVKEEVGSPEILFLDGGDVVEEESKDFPMSRAGENEENEGGAQELQQQQQQQQQQHKGLARKVLPDVIGLFHSHFWKNLWGPNV